MIYIAIQIGVMEIVVFSFSFLLLLGTIYFFRKTVISLRAIKEVQKRNTNRMRNIYMQSVEEKTPLRSDGFFSRSKNKNVQQVTEKTALQSREKNNVYDEETIMGFKKSILQQKQQLDKFLEKVDGWKDQQQASAAKKEDAGLLNKIERLEILLEEKEEELQKMQKHNGVSDEMSSRLEEVQSEFEILQNRMAGLEKQAANANQLAMDLEDIKEEYTQLKTEQLRKQEKMQELMNSNSRLQQLLYETEDKLINANTQRQQLLKKTKLLEELNTDFQIVSDTNSKMKNELRRIGELESMLNMMTEERDHLLSKRVH